MGRTDLGFDSNVRIGLTVGTMATVKIEPVVEFFYEDTEKIVCGKTIATGFPRCRWTYPNMRLTGEQYYQLQGLVGDNLSVSVVLDIPTNSINVTTYEPQIGTYQAVMHWPKDGVKRTMYNEWEIEEEILFTNLEPV